MTRSWCLASHCVMIGIRTTGHPTVIQRFPLHPLSVIVGGITGLPEGATLYARPHTVLILRTITQIVAVGSLSQLTFADHTSIGRKIRRCKRRLKFLHTPGPALDLLSCCIRRVSECLCNPSRTGSLFSNGSSCHRFSGMPFGSNSPIPPFGGTAV